MAGGYPFERSIVKQCNEFLKNNGHTFRLKQYILK